MPVIVKRRLSGALRAIHFLMCQNCPYSIGRGIISASQGHSGSGREQFLDFLEGHLLLLRSKEDGEVSHEFTMVTYHAKE